MKTLMQWMEWFDTVPLSDEWRIGFVLFTALAIVVIGLPDRSQK